MINYAIACVNPPGEWIYTQDQVGATEGGSSGSPVVNSAGQVVGQLSGGCGYDVYNTCNNTVNSTVDGAFAAYYDQVAPWLGSGGPCTDSHRRLVRASFFLVSLARRILDLER
jgi:hypothetical protein